VFSYTFLLRLVLRNYSSDEPKDVNKECAIIKYTNRFQLHFVELLHVMYIDYVSFLFSEYLWESSELLT
jgi:hypothetical protein